MVQKCFSYLQNILCYNIISLNFSLMPLPGDAFEQIPLNWQRIITKECAYTHINEKLHARIEVA